MNLPTNSPKELYCRCDQENCTAARTFNCASCGETYCANFTSDKDQRLCRWCGGEEQ